MSPKKELEIVRHSKMNYLEILMVELTSRMPHGHDDLEIGILLKGSLELHMENETRHLTAGDIYLINSFQVHAFQRAENDNLVILFQIPSDLYCRIHPRLNLIWFLDNVIRSDCGETYDKIRESLIQCTRLYYNNSDYADVLCTSILLDVIYTLLSKTRTEVRTEQLSAAVHTNTRRLNRITKYISAHYTDRISLQDIATQENITENYLSHLIRDMLGISFQEYLSIFRFEHALRLANSDHPPGILDITLDSGYSSSRYLNSDFRKYLGMSVKEYLSSDRTARPRHKELPSENIQRKYSFEKTQLKLQHILSGVS